MVEFCCGFWNSPELACLSCDFGSPALAWEPFAIPRLGFQSTSNLPQYYCWNQSLESWIWCLLGSFLCFHLAHLPRTLESGCCAGWVWRLAQTLPFLLFLFCPAPILGCCLSRFGWSSALWPECLGFTRSDFFPSLYQLGYVGSNSSAPPPTVNLGRFSAVRLSQGNGPSTRSTAGYISSHPTPSTDTGEQGT